MGLVELVERILFICGPAVLEKGLFAASAGAVGTMLLLARL
jgi:hypothetical protein